jgi:hypothetical protein
VKLKFIEQAGAWYTLPSGERIQGREKLLEALRAQPAMVEDIRRRAIESRASEIITGAEADPFLDPELEDLAPGEGKG